MMLGEREQKMLGVYTMTTANVAIYNILPEQTQRCEFTDL